MLRLLLVASRMLPETTESWRNNVTVKHFDKVINNIVTNLCVNQLFRACNIFSI